MQRGREAEASLATARRQAEREEAATTATTDAVATATSHRLPATSPTTASADTAAAAAVELPACVVCLEPYSAARGVVPRILVTCGHSFCEVCLDRMLEPLALKKGRKRLPCPTCRTECAGKGGRAAELELPTVYDMMGA